MPIYSSKDLIPFVNQLEQKIIQLNTSVVEWDANKMQIINATGRVQSNYTLAMQALVKADEAMAEIGTATFKSTANRGKRLEDTLNQLKQEIYEIAEELEVSGGGGGALTEGVYYDELNNAIASVDATVEDGLKLDYRLRELQEMAEQGVVLSDKELYMPYKYEAGIVESFTHTIPVIEDIIFIDGEVTVLNEAYEPLLDSEGSIVTGTINAAGEVVLTAIPSVACSFYFPVQMKLKDIPQDFLYLFMQQTIQKNSRIMEIVLNFEKEINTIIEDIAYMKGVNWTPDFSIMKNYQEIVKESITPKGLHVEVKDGLAHVNFSFNEHPHLSHFVLEKWDEEKKTYVPYDGKDGIINK